jgi:chemosensory pili system protein ChpA (sensor histidine kinase/response regulator)
MDVVRSEVEALKGALDLQYTPGHGTAWIIRLPLTLSITEGVIIQSGRQNYALPVNAVLGALILTNTEIQQIDGKPHANYAGEMLPVIRLGNVLDTDAAETAEYGLAISSLDRKAILLVHQLLGRAELPMKSLDPVTACHPLFESATIDPQGSIVPVLSATAVMDAAASGYRPMKGTAVASIIAVDRPKVLVVDDSVSVRRVQTRMLESLGCDVVAANDGLHALECLREHSFHMILTDLEMPRLNGFELIAEIKSNPTWATVPTIVISSRSADKYVAKAMNLGATSFLFKPFTEAQISSLLNHHIQRTTVAA